MPAKDFLLSVDRVRDARHACPGCCFKVGTSLMRATKDLRRAGAFPGLRYRKPRRVTRDCRVVQWNTTVAVSCCVMVSFPQASASLVVGGLKSDRWLIGTGYCSNQSIRWGCLCRKPIGIGPLGRGYWRERRGLADGAGCDRWEGRASFPLRPFYYCLCSLLVP